MVKSAENPVVSVIVPFYNAANHLVRCLDSIRHEVKLAFEVLCIDDQSTDHGSEIIKHICKKDNRVRLLSHPQNLGPGAARNTGISVATGNYLIFVDADDTLVPGALAHLFSLAELHDSDLVKGAYEEIFERDNAHIARWSSSQSGVLKTSLLESGLLQTIPGPHCSYLFRRELIIAHDIEYPTDLLLGEDLVFVAHALLVASNVKLTPEVVYRYHQCGPSLSRGALKPAALLAAIEQKKRVARLMRAHGQEKLAVRHLSRWNHQVMNYWPQMALTLSLVDCQRVFRAFRSVVPDLIIPWTQDTPQAHRNVLAHILLGEEQQAYNALRSIAADCSKASWDQTGGTDSAVDRWTAKCVTKNMLP